MKSTFSRPTLTGLLAVVAIAILVQAVLAGSFISGVANQRQAHLIVGSLLAWFMFVPTIVAIVGRVTGRMSNGLLVGTSSLFVLVWVQSTLGHVSLPNTIAIHVPLGVLLFAGSSTLALASARSTTSADTDQPPPTVGSGRARALDPPDPPPGADVQPDSPHPF